MREGGIVLKNKNIFQLIHATEIINNSNIVYFMKRFPHKIGVTPVLVLAELRNSGAQKQTVLADKIGCTPGAMTNISNKLVKAGYAVRKYNDDDRRHVLLDITEEGLKVFNEAQTFGREFQTELFDALTDEEIEQYVNIQDKLLAAAIQRNEK